MFELGNITNALSGGRVLNLRRRAVPESPSVANPRAAPDGQVVAAAGPNSSGARQPEEPSAIGELNPAGQAIEEMAAAIRAKLEKFRELIEGITEGRFSAENLAEGMEGQAKQIRDDETSEAQVYSDVSSLLNRFREAVTEIRSSDGFLIGVHQKIEQFIPQAEFDLNQVEDVEEHVADTNADTELGIFSLAHVREDALKALRGQESPEPQRALALLKDNADGSDTAEKASSEQTQSDEIDLMV